MRTLYKNKWLLALLALGFVACQSDDDTMPSPEEEVLHAEAGSADFSKFVAVGNSLTAGYTDGALFIAGQQNSLPNILSQRFALAGGGDFVQPLIDDNIGGLLLGGTPIAEPRLFFNGSGPERLSDMPTTEVSNVLSGSFNNLGVPGAKSFHLLAEGYGNVGGVATGQANPYYARFASSGAASMLGDALAQSPTFFSLWIGNNDVLAYATSGGVGVNQQGNLDPSTYGGNDITDPNVFASIYTNLAGALAANGAKGVVANIPNVTSIPYFTTVPHNPVPLDAATAAMLNGAFQQYNDLLVVAEGADIISEEERIRRTIHFVEGNNAVLIEDEYLTELELLGNELPNIRQATADDLIVLPASAFIGTLVGGNPQAINGVTIPLGDQWVLLPEEQQEVVAATTAFNQIIQAVAADLDLAFVDVHAILNEMAMSDVPFDEYFLNASLVFGGAFSLDGVHPTARGYAYLANQFMTAIDATYGSVLPHVRARDYTTIYPASM